MLSVCFMELETDYEGNNIDIEKTEDPDVCSQLCASTKGCLFWTWRMANTTCALKNSDSGRRDDLDATSGSKECGISMKLILKLTHFTIE